MYHAVRLINTLLPLFYLTAVLFYSIDYLRAEPAVARIARQVMNVTLGLHVAFLVGLTVLDAHVPLATMPQWLSTVAFAIALVYVIVERRTGVQRTGAFLLALPLLLQIIASAFLEIGAPVPAILESPLFAAHTLMAVVGYAAFSVSAIYSVLYLLMHRALKGTRFGLTFDRLPPLATLARMTLRAAEVGVVALTLTIAFGTIWAVQEVPGFAGDPKFVLTLIVWGAYVAALVLHRHLQWSERSTIRGCLIGFALLVLAALASRLVLDTFHVFA